jgi:hypothetical protein
MDTRLYFLKDPIIVVVLLFIGVLGVAIKQQKKHTQQGTVTQYKIESNTETDITETQQKTDTTEWRKSYYEHLYSNSK